MEEFYENFSIPHVVTIPYHPASNEKTESVVKTVKTFLKKTYNSQDFSISMLTYHDIPLSVMLPTPAELMFGKWIHRDIPSKIVYEQEEEQEEESAHFIQKMY